MAYPGFLSMPFDPSQRPGMLGGMGQPPGVLNGASNQSAGLLGGLLGPGPHPIASALGDRSAALLGFGLPLLLSHWEKDALPAAMAGLQGGQQMDFARRQARDKQTREAQQQAALAKALQVYGVDTGLAAVPEVAGSIIANQMNREHWTDTTVNGLAGQRSDKTNKFDPYSTAAVHSARPMTPQEKAAYGIAANDPNPWIIDETGKPAVAGGRAAQTNINVPPTPEKGYRNVYDDQGRLVSQEPIPGGPVARADSVREGQSTQRSLAAVNAIDTALGKLEGPDAPPQWQTSGIIGAGLKNWPIIGQASTDLANTLATVKSSVTIETLQQMRQSSPTGGALGAVSNYEDQLLGNAKTNIEQSTNGAELARNLKYLKALIQYEVDGVPGITPQQWQQMSDQQKAEAVDAAAQKAAATASEGWQDMGNGTRIRRVR